MRVEKIGKIIVTGGRDSKDRDLVFRVLNALQSEGGEIREIVQGGAHGVDAHARAWAKQNLIGPYEMKVSTWVTTVRAQWGLLGRAAGPARNKTMLIAHRDAAALVAFPGGPGTAHCSSFAHAIGIPVIRVKPDGTWAVEERP